MNASNELSALLYPASNTPVSLSLRLFGSFELIIGDKNALTLSRAAKSLIALLILNPDAPLAREWLAEALWQDTAQAQALFYLRRCLVEVRQVLGTERDRVIAAGGTLRFDTSAIFCDLLAFDALGESEDEPVLRQAEALYRGPLLAELEADWLNTERERYRERYLIILEKIAHQCEQRGAFSDAVQILRRVVIQEPLRESTYCRIMEVLGRSGDFAEIERHYRELRRILHSELNMEPSADTIHCYNTLKERSESVTAIPTQPAAPTRRLPCPLTSLIGRKQERIEIAAALQNSRLVTLTGSGGIGKSRLALAVAEENAEHWTQGVWWIDLAAQTQGVQIPATVASVLGIKEQGKTPLLQTLVAVLKEWQTLLILDNCEHLIVACAEFSATLLEECPRLQILATSRQPLGMHGETAWRVPSLPVPPSDSLASISTSEAVQLFVERAQAANRSFRLTSENAAAIAQVCTTLDGIPLALELAAVWVKSLTVAQIADRLADRFALLTTGNRTAPTRHQTLRTLIEWSFHLLDARERELFMQLSVFSGGWTLEAAEAVCHGETFAGTDVLLLLNRLVEQSLIEVDSQKREPRYRFLETVRQFAQEQIRKSDARELHRRHRDYYVQLAEANCPQLGKADTLILMEQLEAEYDNMRLALRLCQSEPEGVEVELRLATMLGRFARMHGNVQGCAEYLQAALNRQGVDLSSRLYRDAIYTRGLLQLNLDDYSAGQRIFEEALALYQKASEPLNVVEALRMIGTCLLAQDRNVEAKNVLAQALEISRCEGGECVQGRVLMALGIVAKNEGKSSEAIALLTDAIQIFEAHGELEYAGIALHNLGNALKESGEYEQAARCYVRSLNVHRCLGKRAWQGINLFELGAAHHFRGELEQAKLLTEEASLLLKYDYNMSTLCLQQLGAIAVSSGDVKQAKRLLPETIERHYRLGTKRNLSFVFWTLARLAIDSEEPLFSARFLAMSEKIREQIGFTLAAGDLPYYEELIQQTREMLTHEEFTNAYAVGLKMTLEEGVSLALEYCVI